VRFSSRQNIQILINRLQQEGLVEFVSNPDHKRSALVRLTNHGQAAIAEAGKVLAELNTKILPSFSQSELSSATEVLSKLRALLRPRDVPARRGTEMAGGASLSEQQLAHENPQPASEQPVSGFGSPSSDEGGLPVSLL
jgi:hypothetical protein